MKTKGLVYTDAEIADLLEHEEGQFIEFKSVWDQTPGKPRSPLDRREVRDTVAEYVAAFANADGGTLLLGVEDDGTPTGHGYPDEAIAEILAVPERRLQPTHPCRTQRARTSGGEIIVFQVSIAPTAVMVGGNGFPYRIDDKVFREPQEVINERKEAYRRVGFEQRIRAEATLSDLDLDLARKFLSKTVYRDREVEEALEAYGLVQPRAEGAAITNAALLLFGRGALARWHPRSGIRFFRVAGKERTHGSKRNVSQIGHVEAPLAAAIPEAYRLTKEQIRRSEKLHDLFFREMPEYPEFAWQEAIVNAFAHHDYEDQSRESEVWFFEDRMEIRSPGVLIPQVSLEHLRQRKRSHASRNPLLVRVLADLALMREEGEGIPRIFEEMEESFLHPPALDVETGEFVVTLRNEPIFVGPSPEWQRLVERLPIGIGQRRVLLAHPDGFSNEDYRRLNGVDRDQAYREIQEMVSLGVILPAEAPGRGAIYRVSPDLHEARAFLQERTPALRTFFSRYPSIQNADYRRLFGLTRAAAKRELARLTEEGFLRMEGERRGARYVPGPSLDGGKA